MMGNKDVDQLVKAATKQGFTVQRSRKGHPMFYKDGKLAATCSGTPSDFRSLRNTIADLRRAGFQWPPQR